MLDDVIKNTLKFQHERNGLFLRIHHTKPLTSSSLTSEEDGLAAQGSTRSCEKRLRFIYVDIMSSNEAFAAVDEEDNIFIFHLTEKCFWQLPIDSKVRKCTAIKFVPQNKNNLLLGNKFGFIYEIEINSGIVQRCIKAFLNPINQLLFSTSSLDPRTLVVSSSNHIKIYDYENFRKKFDYARDNNESKISFIKTVPSDETGRIAVILRNNVICILSSSLKLIRHYEPLKARNKYVQRFHQKVEKLNYSESPPDEIVSRRDNTELKSNADNLIKTVTRDYSNGLVTDLSFSSDGSHLVVSFLDNFIMLCSTLWDVRKLIKYPDGLGVRQCDFIPFVTMEHHNEATNKLLLTLTSNDELMLMSFADLNAKTLDYMNNSTNYALASNGKMLLNIQHSGEILVYNMEECLKQTTFSARTVDAVKNGHHESNFQWNVELGKIQTKISSTIPIGRLLPILKEFDSYPDKYRSLIWKTILQLPLNYSTFSRLICSGLHSCVENFQEKFSFVDQKTQKSLLKLVSCLSHWTSIFGYVNYLPKFVFPFLKVCKGDLLMCFEIVATLILNHCQLWFEFAPLQMPYNYFCLIENVLMESDGELYEFYKSKSATPKIYAWPLMETAFSEVFDERQWFEIWDHIVSNEPYFMVFIIVAYNLALRSIILRADDVEEIENVFHEQSYVEVRKVVRKAYRLMSKCPSQIHPRRYMKPFAGLLHGEYQKFQNFPKNIAADKVNEIDVIRAEQKQLDQKLSQMDCIEKTINSRLQNHLMSEEYSKRMREVESAYEQALEEEEERILCMRKKLLLSTRKIREREHEMMIQGRQSAMRKQLETRENELNEMLRRLEKQRNKEEIELRLADETLKLNEIAIEMKTFPVDVELKSSTLGNRFENSLQQLEHQKQKLMKELEAISLLRAGNDIPKPRTDVSDNDRTTSDRAVSVDGEGSTSETLREVEQLENNFQRIQDGFLEAIKNDKEKADYVQRMKELEQASETLEKEIYEILSGTQ